MTTEQPYVPGHNTVRHAFAMHRHATTWPSSTLTEACAEFDRFIAQVRRDAAREALDGLASEVRRLIPQADAQQADRMKYAAGLLAAEAANYPEVTP